MSRSSHDQPSPLDFGTLLPAAVRQILRDEDPQRFQAWLRDHLHDYMTPEGRRYVDAEAARALATVLGTGIWNATPLPGNHFRPRPLPRPGRNSPCPCGSGRKFKHCCATAPEFDAIPTAFMWELLAEALPRREMESAIAGGHVPIGALATYARSLLERGSAKRAAQLLEPVFAGPLKQGSEHHEFALDTLLDAYDELGHPRKKRALIDRVTAQAPRSPLRAGAWQRLASIRSDRGDVAGAWEAFRNAQRDDPDEPALGNLEVLLLVADGRIEEARERAKFWIRRLRREGAEEYGPLIEWLGEVAADPERAIGGLGIRGAGGSGLALRAWLEKVRARPLPEYRVSDNPEDMADSSGGDERERWTRQLRQLGIPPGERETLIGELDPDELAALAEEHAFDEDDLDEDLLLEDFEDEADDEEDFVPEDLAEEAEAGERADEDFVPEDLDATGLEEEDFADEDFADEDLEEEAFSELVPPPEESLFLLPPAELRGLEAEWHQVFPLAKPFGLSDAPLGEADAWDRAGVEKWSSFLEDHPEAFDSLEILDDLATAVLQYPSGEGFSIDSQLLAPVLERAHDIIEHALAPVPEPALAWVYGQNRAPLRSLVRLFALRLREETDEAAVALAERILALNPDDHHALRNFLVNHYLQTDRDRDALDLAEEYPKDISAMTGFGAVLALYRLGRLQEAEDALADVLEQHGAVVRYLTAPRIRRPKLSPHGVVPGGEDEAWYFREEMRPVWKATPGALAWLAQTAERYRR